jgi:cyclophilin family peptidyl-prolyl cis-trans isomerase
VLVVGGIVLAGLGYVAASSFLVAPSPSPLPTFGGVGADGCPTSQPAALPAGETRTVTIETELGDIVITVEGSLSPIAAGNFVALAECGYYDGVVFHRTATMQDGTPFVIQGGDPTGSGSGGPGYTIQDELVTATYHRGTVAMARTQAADSQGSQFFIVLDDRAVTPLVSANTYAIFGEVVSGMEVADAIYQASDGVQLPGDPVVMTDVSVSSP